MSRQRRDDGPRSERTAAERERARLEREARRTGEPAPSSSDPASPTTPRSPKSPKSPKLRKPSKPSKPIPPKPRAQRPPTAPAETPSSPARAERPPPAPAEPTPPRGRAQRPPPAAPKTTSGRGRGGSGRGRTAPPAGRSGKRPLLRIQPKPPPPPAAAGGELDDETERPIGIRRVRRPVGPIVTPPGDTAPGPARARRSVKARMLAFLALAVLAIVVIAMMMLFQPFGRAEGAPVSVTIPPGSGARAIGDRLADAGVVGSGMLFSLRATLAGKRADLRSGDHRLRRDMTYGAAIEQLSTAAVTAKGATIDVTIPEGRTRREIASIARKARLRGSYLAASKRFAGALNPFGYGAPKGTRSLEGFLFPATYELDRGAEARELVQRQLAAFADNFAGVKLDFARRKNLTGYDVLIIASMVEREARLASERPLVAAVIYNRLKDGIPLGIDATTRYALDKPSGALRQSELAIDSPYNTRKRAGLPPTPIGNPGLSSMRAAASPANVSYRYFVVKPGTCGEHAFSTSDEQFQRDSQRYRVAREQAGGQSPTTC